MNGAPPAKEIALTTAAPAEDLATSSTSPPADVSAPLGRAAWSEEPSEPSRRRFGSATDPGPAAAAADKGNQDFAFHLELQGPDSTPWIVLGVADGVSQATWSARGARHAAAAFVEAFADLARYDDFPRGEAGLSGDVWPRTLARLFHRRVLERMERDREGLLRERHVDPTWTRELFERTFWTGEGASRELGKWFQTTLLAAALGPHGGFALLLGDGFVRVDRRLKDGTWQSSPGLDPTRPVSFALTEQDVFSGIERIAQRGATELGILVTTDGVSKSSPEGLSRAMEGLGALAGAESKPPLERLAPASTAECEAFLERLSASPPGMADVDNMSVAFGARILEPEKAG